MRRTVGGVLAFVTCLGVASVHGQTPADSNVAPAGQEPRSYSDQVTVAASHVVILEKDGPKDQSAFGDPGRPFLLAQLVCLAGSAAADVDALGALFDARPNRLKKDRLSMLRQTVTPGTTVDRKECEQRLSLLMKAAAAMRGKEVALPADLKAELDKFNAQRWLWIDNQAPQALQLRAIDPDTGEACVTFPSIPVGFSSRIDLAMIGCGRSKRVELLMSNASSPDEVLAVMSLTFDLPEELKGAPFTSVTRPGSACKTVRQFEIRLDATGVDSSRYRNPRRPLFLDHGQDSTDPIRYRCAEIRFVNRVVSRQFLVTFSDLDKNAQTALMSVPGGIVHCSGASCSASFRVGPASEISVPLSALYRGYVVPKSSPAKAKVVAFAVSFYDDDREPAFPRGYFSLVAARDLLESGSATRWSSAVSADYSGLADLSAFDAPAAALPPVAANDWRARGNVRVSLKQSLSGRVNTDFEVRLKRGEYGGTEPAVTTTRFRVDVNTLNGTVFSAGRAGVATPSEGIAISEGGDSFGVRFWHVQLNHLFRAQVREAIKPTLQSGAFRADREHHTTVLQLAGIPLSCLGTLDAIATYGVRRQARSEDDPTAAPKPATSFVETRRWYRTVGGEVSTLLPLGARMVWASYWSRAETNVGGGYPIGTDDGGGRVMLGTLSWTNFDHQDTPVGAEPEKRAKSERQGKAIADWTFQLRYGRGSAELDDSTAPHRQEAYAGESEAFAPDVIFLSTLVPAVHSSDTRKPALGSALALTPGLGNKEYLGAVVNIPRVDALARFLQLVLPKDSVSAPSLSFVGHAYRSHNTSAFGRNLGAEFDAVMTLEAPKGVKTSITAAVFQPGSGLSSVPATSSAWGRLSLDRRIWAVVAAVNVLLQ